MRPDRFPNLFLAGAPKCGTTSLVHYLSQHPDVFVPVVKEPVFFGRDLTAESRIGLSEYLRLYRGWADENWALDASTHYFYSQTAAHEIAAASPTAKIVIMVRNPTEAAHSMYHQLRFNGAERLESFEDSLAAEKQRSKERRAIRFGFPENLLYRSIYSYSMNISRFEEVFGKDRLHVVLLDDLKNDPLREVEGLLRVLDLDPAPANSFSFEAKNSAKRPRSRWLNTLANYPSTKLRMLTAPFPKSVRLAFRKKLSEFNTVPARNPELQPETRARLEREFEGEVRWLSDYLGRDLSGWLSEK